MMPKLAIVAGGGTLPLMLARACREQASEPLIVALSGHADSALFDGFEVIERRLGQAGDIFRQLKRRQISDVVLAGSVRRPSLKDLCPDWRTARFFARLGLRAFGDDGLLRAVIREIEAEGLHVVGIDDLFPSLLAAQGVFGRISPDDQAVADIQRGREVACGLGALDVGQSVVVQQGIVLGVEAIEGTDALVARCKDLHRQGVGGVLVKMKKPAQDRRADLPTIGVETVRAACAAGLRGIALEAGGVIVLGHQAVTDEADRLGLFITGIAP